MNRLGMQKRQHYYRNIEYYKNSMIINSMHSGASMARFKSESDTKLSPWENYLISLNLDILMYKMGVVTVPTYF